MDGVCFIRVSWCDGMVWYRFIILFYADCSIYLFLIRVVNRGLFLRLGVCIVECG